MLPRIVDILDEPIGDPAAINTLLMCEAARDAGRQGAAVRDGRRRAVRRLPQAPGQPARARATRRLPGRCAPGWSRRACDRLPGAAGGRGLRTARWAKRFLSFADLPEEAAFRRSYTLYDPDELTGLLDPDLSATVDDRRRLTTERLYDDRRLDDHVNRMCLADTRLFLPGLNLTYTDRSSMAASTEVRVPFVDPDVFAAAFSLPGSQKIRGPAAEGCAQGRRRAAGCPTRSSTGPRRSFSAPLRAWVTNDLGPLVDDVLAATASWWRRASSRLPPLRRMVADQRSGRRDQSKQLWQLLMELWYRNATAAGVASP